MGRENFSLANISDRHCDFDGVFRVGIVGSPAKLRISLRLMVFVITKKK